MAEWNLKEGSLNNIMLSDEEIWEKFNYLFSSKSKNKTTYKFAFLKVFIDNVFEVNSNNEIYLDKLLKPLTKVYWNLIVVCELRQIHMGKQECALTRIFNKYIVSHPELKFKEYKNLDEKYKIELESEVSSVLLNYVVGATYEDLNGVIFGFFKRIML